MTDILDNIDMLREDIFWMTLSEYSHNTKAIVYYMAYLMYWLDIQEGIK